MINIVETNVSGERGMNPVAMIITDHRSKIGRDGELKPATPLNQSVENAGVAFVKGANEKNGFFEKIN